MGVRQGDNVSFVIFLFLMSAFAESLEKEWKQSGLPKSNIQKRNKRKQRATHRAPKG